MEAGVKGQSGFFDVETRQDAARSTRRDSVVEPYDGVKWSRRVAGIYHHA